MKAGLRLTPEQERLWQPVEDAVRNLSNSRLTRMEERRAARGRDRNLDLMQRLEERSSRLSEQAQQSTALTTALRPLWNALSDDQKRVAPRLLRGMGGFDRGGPRRWGHHRGHHGDHGRMGMMRGGPGMGPGGPDGAPGTPGAGPGSPGGPAGAPPPPAQPPRQP
jgi:hypothetical protein